MNVCRWECCVLSGRGLCDELITRPEEFYRLWPVVVCDLETSWMRRSWPTGGCCTNKKNNEEKDCKKISKCTKIIQLRITRRVMYTIKCKWESRTKKTATGFEEGNGQILLREATVLVFNCKRRRLNVKRALLTTWCWQAQPMQQEYRVFCIKCA
jgi:hypothetical protein